MFKGLNGLGDMAKMMQQAKDMQNKVAEMQQALATMTVTTRFRSPTLTVIITAPKTRMVSGRSSTTGTA